MYTLSYNCVSPASKEELDIILDNMVEITGKTFLKYVPFEEVKGFAFKKTKKSFLDDWSLRFYKLKRKKMNLDVYVLVWSGIDHIFKKY